MVRPSDLGVSVAQCLAIGPGSLGSTVVKPSDLGVSVAQCSAIGPGSLGSTVLGHRTWESR